MILREASSSDAEELARFGKDSFAAAFGHMYRPEDLAAFNEQTFHVDGVRGEIEGEACTHRIAELDGRIIGYCKMRHPSKLADHSRARDAIELCQLYTDPSMTGQGIGAALMEWALDLARRNSHDAIQLSVWSGNHGAQRFYQRYGFTKIADITFEVGEQVDEEYLFEMRI